MYECMQQKRSERAEELPTATAGMNVNLWMHSMDIMNPRRTRGEQEENTRRTGGEQENRRRTGGEHEENMRRT